MDKNSKIILIIIATLAAATTIFSLSLVDWQSDWYFLAYILAFIMLTLLAVFDIKKSILLTIFILPIAMSLNYFKSDEIGNLPVFNYQDIPINIVSVILTFIILLAAITVLFNWKKLKKLPLKYIILPYFVFIILSVLWASNKNVVLMGIAYFMAPFSIYILSYIYFNQAKDLIKLLSVSIASLIPVIILSVIQIINNQYFFEELSGLKRLNGPFPHPNIFASYLFVVLSFITIFFFSKKNRRLLENKSLLIFGSLALTALIMTFSRSAWASLFLFVIIYAYCERQIIFILASLSPIAIFISLFFDSIRGRIVDIFNYSFFDSMSARKNIWEVSFNQIIKHPILGHGTGTSESVIEANKTWLGGSSLPHNDFILYSIESGIIGLIFFTSYIIMTPYYLWQRYQALEDKYIKLKIWGFDLEINLKKLTFGILAIFLAMILASFFDSNTRRVVTQMFIWAVIGSLLAQKNTPAT
jgi:O-antigen ligase